MISYWLVALSKTALNKQNVPYFTWIPNETGREKIEVRLHENSAQTLKYKMFCYLIVFGRIIDLVLIAQRMPDRTDDIFLWETHCGAFHTI